MRDEPAGKLKTVLVEVELEVLRVGMEAAAQISESRDLVISELGGVQLD